MRSGSIRSTVVFFSVLASLVPTRAWAQPLSFPVDEGYHSDAEFEMWSLLAHVTGPDGRELGVGVMFFSGRAVGLKVSGTFNLLADATELEWSATRDLVVPLFGRANHTEGSLDERYDRSRLWRDTDGAWINVLVRTGGIELSLEFEPTLEPVDFGDVPVGPASAQRVYAFPAGVVRGRISKDGGAAEELTGVGVFQHAWGDSPDPSRVGSQFSAHFDDGTALVAYHSDTDDPVHVLSIQRPGSSPFVTDGFVAEAIGRPGGDPDDAFSFPLGWRFQAAADSSSVNIRFEATTGGQPVRVLGMPFWVGRCEVSGSLEGVNVEGSGYVLIRGVEVEGAR